MIKSLLLVFLLVVAFSAKAQERPVGFLWYNLPQVKKETPHKTEDVSFNKLSYTQKDAVLRIFTMEALHKARHTKSVEDMRVFLSLQHYWLNEATDFSHTFAKAMLAYPQYDYTVTHPVSTLGSKWVDEARETLRQNVIEKLSQSHGLLLFYRGANQFDLKQIPIVRDFCNRFHFSLIPVSVDGTISEALPYSRKDLGEANRLNVRFFPALILVNPKTKSTQPLAYGLTTQDVLEKRLVQVANHFQGEVA